VGRRILIVDDEEINLRLTEYILRNHSYEVITANSGAQGLDLLRRRMIDLVLLDIEMPVMNGFRMFEYIKKEYANLPVIFLTASGDKRDVLEVIRMGAVDYVRKPFDPKVLAERVAHALEHRF
jgi:putative two-component system response regulator